jgi:hypothetical protein
VSSFRNVFEIDSFPVPVPVPYASNLSSLCRSLGSKDDSFHSAELFLLEIMLACQVMILLLQKSVMGTVSLLPTAAGGGGGDVEESARTQRQEGRK